MKCSIDLYAGLLGAGKTTLINQLLATEYKGKKIAVIENEIGKINLDAGELAGPDITVTELTNGCVCCTIRGAFSQSVDELAETIQPDVIIIEPTGAADISGIIEACSTCKNAELRRVVLVANAKKLPILLDIVGPFYIDQLRCASCIYLNFADTISSEKLAICMNKVREINPTAVIISVPVQEVDEKTFSIVTGSDSKGFPESIFRNPKKPTLKVEEAGKKASRMLPSGRSKDTTIYTWTLKVSHPLSVDEFKKLKTALLDPKNGELWRVKGIVPMQDGTLRRIDLTFGDFFEKEQAEADEEIVGRIVVIGKSMRN
ncbi:MAG: hypothetical protein MJ116_11365, partial [Lachnospiraceae bacterium]|nr:hypothetical protein [Lachnospiraceae bacterium]